MLKNDVIPFERPFITDTLKTDSKNSHSPSKGITLKCIAHSTGSTKRGLFLKS